MRTLIKDYSSIVVLDRDDVALKLMEIFLRGAGFTGTIVKTSFFEEVAEFLSGNKTPVLLITDYYTNYLNEFSFFAENYHRADKVIVIGEFEDELKRFMLKYPGITYYRKPHKASQVQEWIEKDSEQ